MSWLKISAIVIALIVIVYFASLSYLTRHDKIKDEGERQLADCPPTPNCVSSLASNDAKKVEALPIDRANIQASWQKLQKAIQQAGGRILIDDGHYVHAVFTSTLFRFKDDLEALLNEDHIDIRSASRAGKSDLGQNRKRVENIRKIYLGPETVASGRKNDASY